MTVYKTDTSPTFDSQWQGYIANQTATSYDSLTPREYEHRLGYFALGHDAIPPLQNTTFEACRQACDNIGCFGFCFQDPDPAPTHKLAICYVKNATHFQSADLSNSGHCAGTTDISDCPYNLYRTSGDIGTYWDRVLSNLGSTVPFLTPKTPLSRPGAWACE